MSKTIKFNAGKVKYDEDTKKCTPLPHKGQVTIGPAADDGFYEFAWNPKTSSGLEKDELLIIPGDVTFKHVTSCDSGRVVALTFLSSGAKNLYWLQDVGDDEDAGKFTQKDQELVASVQELVAGDEEIDETVDKDVPMSDVPVSPANAFPIVSLEDVLTEEVVRRHLDGLLAEQMAALYRDVLPDSVEPTKDDIIRILRLGFFHQASKELGLTMAENNVGHVLASSFGYEYQGEGIEAFLRGIRLMKKDKQ